MKSGVVKLLACPTCQEVLTLVTHREVGDEIIKGALGCSSLQADLVNAPFPAVAFDVVWSEGVIVHTRDPKKAFASLAGLVKPGGGKLYVWSLGYSTTSRPATKPATQSPKWRGGSGNSGSRT